ncbi:MAG: hypothetical protein GY869_28335, partial [Planctomycetes bacterium]|nr:hypothetical protein [Planctomycetota bacterium]
MIINDVRAYDYNFLLSSSFRVGTNCHEFFHSLGAPDLYHYSHDGLSPAGSWDLMASSGTTPRHMTAYMKFKYGQWFDTLPEITAAGAYTLSPLSMSPNSCYKVASPTSATEFFMVEYRRQEGTFESVIPGSGLIVYRINTAYHGNANGPPDELYVYRPDGTPTINGSNNQAHFSSDVGRTAINDGTNPSSFLTDGSPGGLNIFNVGSAGSSISFQIEFGAPLAPSLPNPADYAINVPTTADLSWVNGGNTDYVNVYFDTDQTLVTNKDASVRVVTNQYVESFDPGTLQNNTTYYWRVTAHNAMRADIDGPVWEFMTECLTESMPFTEGFDTAEAPDFPDCWTQNQGWTVNSSSNAGGASPEARLNWSSAIDGSRLISPAINTSGYSSLELVFYSFIDDYSGSGYTLSVQTSVDAVIWSDVWSISPTGNVEPQTETVSLISGDGVGSSTFFLGFTITGAPFGIDYWYIDNISLTSQTTPTYASVPYVTGFETGNIDVFWTTGSTADGRVRVLDTNTPYSGAYHLVMDDGVDAGSFSLNNADLHMNLSGQTQTWLSFWWKDFGDETNTEDGVYFSDDSGANFTKVYELNGDSYTNDTWSSHLLDAVDLAATAGLGMSSTFIIRFQQYDDYGITTDGFAFDDILVTNDAPQTSITVTYPNGGETFTETEYININWSSPSPSGFVKIDYTLDSSNWQTLTGTTANDGGFGWSLPEVTSDQSACRVRISNVSDPSVFDVSDNDFTILNVDCADAFESNDDIASAHPITPGDYDACIDPLNDTDYYSFRADQGDTITLYSIGINNSEIDDEVWLFDPSGASVGFNDDGNGNWHPRLIYGAQQNGIYTARWAYYANNPAPGRDLDDKGDGIMSTRLGEYRLTLERTPTSVHSYAAIPYTTGFESGELDQHWTSASNEYGRIRVLDTNSPFSGTYHTALDKGVNGGNYATNTIDLHVDLAGQTQAWLNFWWKDFSDETHSSDGVYVSDDGGTIFTKLYDLNGGTYSDNNWSYHSLDLTDPTGVDLSATYVIRFQQYDNYGISSDGFAFDDIEVTNVTPPDFIILQQPNGGENWLEGSSYSITWTSNIDDQIRLEVSTDNGSSWQLITSAITNDGQYAWTVFDVPTDYPQSLIRVSSESNSAIFDDSDNTFTIAQLLEPGISVTPTSISDQLLVGDNAVHVLSIDNPGNATLDWTMYVQIDSLPQTPNIVTVSYRNDENHARQVGNNRPVTIPRSPAVRHKNLRDISSTLFFDDIENGINGWTTVVYGVDDLWHQTTLSANSPVTSWWCGVDTSQTYATGNTINTAVVSPPIDLSGVTDPTTLYFYEFFDTESGWDFANVEISSDGGVYWQALRVPPSGSSGGWIITALDLSSHTGLPMPIQIRFLFDTGDEINNDFPGWFIDDVFISTGLPWLSASPLSGNVSGGSASPVDVTLDATNLTPGLYHGRLDIQSNVSTIPLVSVPVDLTMLATQPFEYSVLSDWNMIGLPLDVDDPYYLSIFTAPPVISGTLYEFIGSYAATDTLEIGSGYWLRFTEPDTVEIVGAPMDTICTDVSLGWNIVAGPSCNVPLSAVSSDPPGIIIGGSLHAYDGAYIAVDTLKQGQGYWIRVNANGQLCMNCNQATVASHETPSSLDLLENAARLIISDGNGSEQTLYFAPNRSGLSREQFSLPPLPPP